MKKYYNTLGLLLLVVLGCVGQVQISDVQNVVQADDLDKKFIIDNQRLLLVEVNQAKTLVSEVSESGLNLIQEWSHQPPDQRRAYTSNFYNFQYNLFVKGDTLFEVYTQSIYATSITTGALLDTYQLFNTDVVISNIEVIEGKDDWIVKFIRDGKIYYGIYNYGSRQLSERTIVNGTRIGNKLYKALSGNFISEDLITGEINIAVSLAPEGFRINSLWDTRDYYAWIVDGKGRQFYIDARHGVRELPCLLDMDCKNIYWTDSLIFYNIDKGPAFENVVLNSNGCDTLSKTFMTNFVNYFPIQLNSEVRVCYAKYGSSFTTGQNGMYDPVSKEWKNLGFDTDVNFAASQKNIDDRIYISGQNDVELYGFIATLHEVHPENFAVQNKNFYDQTDDVASIIFEIHPTKRYLYAYTRSFKGKSDLWVLKTKGGSPQKIKSFAIGKNRGIQYLSGEYLYKDNLFYFSNGSIYVTNLNGTTKLIDALQCSPFVFYNGFLYALIQRESQLIDYVKINLGTLEIQSKSVGGGFNLDNNVKALGPGLIGSNYARSYYFDARLEQLTDITYEGNKLRISIEGVSKNNVLFYGYIGNQRELYLWDVIQNKMLLINDHSNKFYTVLPDQDGGFYLLPGNFGGGSKVRKLNASGTIQDLTEVGEKPYYYYGSEIGLGGKIHTFPFPGVNTIIFHSEKDGRINVNSLPFENTLYYREFFWKEVEETVVVETEIGGEKHTWIWKFDETPLDVTPAGRTDNLIQAFIQGDTVVLQYQNRSNAEMNFVLYNTKTKVLENKKTITSSQYYLEGSNHEWIDSHTFLLSLFTQDNGIELWKYDISSNELSLVKEFVEGRVGGEPENFTRAVNDIYFLATAPDGSRQWFAIKGVTSVSEPDPIEGTLLLYPNPAFNFVKLKSNIEQIQIYDLSGRIRFTGYQLQEGEKIDLSGFEYGLYLVNIITEQGGQAVSKLVVGGSR